MSHMIPLNHSLHLRTSKVPLHLRQLYILHNSLLLVDRYYDLLAFYTF